MYFLNRTHIKIITGVIIVAAVAGGAWYAWQKKTEVPHYQTQAENDPYVRFDMEAYDQIIKNYWVKPGDYGRFNMPELPELFQLALQKGTGQAETLATTTRTGAADMLAGAIKNATSTDAKRTLALQTVAVVLFNLTPTGRDSLLSKQQETALRQDVANIDTSKNLYQDLGLEKGASIADVNIAYQKKATELKQATSSAAKAELPKVAYAHQVLASPVGKQLYDSIGAEPSVFSHTVGSTLYLDFDKISPTTLQEFALAVNDASTTPGITNLILDMRANVGGQLSFAQDFTGLFIGAGQYAFDLFHQGDTEVQRTTQQKFDQLSRFKHIAIFADSMTQSTAELTTSIMKRFKLATVVGTKTRGWGSVEDTYPLKTDIDPNASYSLLIVNHLTLRDDNQPIEQNGVIPDVDTSQKGWQNQLAQYIDSPSFAETVTALENRPPWRF